MVGRHDKQGEQGEQAEQQRLVEQVEGQRMPPAEFQRARRGGRTRRLGGGASRCFRAEGDELAERDPKQDEAEPRKQRAEIIARRLERAKPGPPEDFRVERRRGEKRGAASARPPAASRTQAGAETRGAAIRLDKAMQWRMPKKIGVSGKSQKDAALIAAAAATIAAQRRQKARLRSNGPRACRARARLIPTKARKLAAMTWPSQ